jgi:hypothetical protein
MSAIADLVRAGVDPDLIQRVADEIAEARARGALEAAPMRSAGALRTARYRDRKASQNVTERHSVTNVTDVTPSDGEGAKKEIPPTPPKEKTNTPKKTTFSCPQAEDEPKPSRASRLAPDWKPSDTGWQFAVNSVGEQRAAVERDKFRDFWIGKGGASGRKLDWEATWRNWIRTASERPTPKLPFGQQSAQPPPAPSAPLPLEEARELARKYHESQRSAQ